MITIENAMDYLTATYGAPVGGVQTVAGGWFWLPPVVRLQAFRTALIIEFGGRLYAAPLALASQVQA